VGCVQARVSEWSLSTLPSPILELQHALVPLQVLWAKERAPIPPSFVVFYLGSHLSPLRSWECVILGTWLHTTLLYEGLDNVFTLPNIQTPSFKFSQIVFAPFQKFVLMSSQNKLPSQQLCKATLLTYDLESIWNFGETWTTMFTTIFQNFNSFNFIKWEILLLSWNHLKLGHEHKMTYNSLSTTPNSLKFWEIHQIYIFYIYSKF